MGRGAEGPGWDWVAWEGTESPCEGGGDQRAHGREGRKAESPWEGGKGAREPP